jgi:uncharacterized protein (DUF2132 family)
MGNYSAKVANCENRPNVCYKVFQHLPKDKTDKKLMIEWVYKCFNINAEIESIIKYLQKDEVSIEKIRYNYINSNNVLYLYIHCHEKVANKSNKEVVHNLNSNWIKLSIIDA